MNTNKYWMSLDDIKSIKRSQVVYCGNGIYQLRTWDKRAEHYSESDLNPDAFKMVYGCHPMHSSIYHPDKFKTPYDMDNAYAKERLLNS